MRKRDILVDLVELPRMFNVGGMSMYEILKQTGYFELDNEVSETDIRKILARNPECVDEWISYSEDKRTSSGWYIKQENCTTYKVGCLLPKGRKGIETIYGDRTDACAAFIKHELEDVRGENMNEVD
jgi:hypothetical protein